MISTRRLLPIFVAAVVLIGLGMPVPAHAQVGYIEFEPSVVPVDRTEPVLFLVRITTNATRVALERNGVEVPMRDDGAEGDSTAGDGIYTLLLQADDITGNLQADDVFRSFVGFLNVYEQETRVTRINIFGSAMTAEIPRIPITALDGSAQHSAYVLNVVDRGFATGQATDVLRIVRRLYEYFPDDFDFVNVVNASARVANRFHFAVKNDVTGLGLELFDGSTQYGSGGRLQGITVFPNLNFFDGAAGGYVHELGHQWINFLRMPPLESGIPHWPLSSLASGIMGWSIPPTGEGGNYPCLLVPQDNGIRLVPRLDAPVFTDLDLYLMGLASPDEVQEHIIFSDQQAARNRPCSGVFTGDVLRVGIGDIINAVGPRIPDSTSAPRQFRIATIVVSKDGLLDADEMAFFDFFARRAEETTETPTHEGFSKELSKPFWVATGGRASINASLVSDRLAPVVTLAGPADGSVVRNEILASATAEDNVGVAGVAFWMGERFIGEATEAPFAVRFNTWEVPNGWYQIWARAVDAAGNSAWASTWVFVRNRTTSRIDNLPVGESDASRTFTGAWCSDSRNVSWRNASLTSCGSGIDTYRFTPKIPFRGQSDVYIRYSAHAARGRHVRVAIVHANGTTVVSVNMRVRGGTWVFLGRFMFDVGFAGFVEVDDSQGPANVDGVRFVTVR